MTEPPDDTDQRFAANFRHAREKAKLSQDDVAEQMRERGYAWHQTTVYRVESASQRVRLGEAEALAAIVGTDASALTRPTGLALTAYDIVSAARKVRTQRRELEGLTARHEADKAHLRRLLEKARGNGTAERLAGEIRVGMAALGERAPRADGAGDDAE